MRLHAYVLAGDPAWVQQSIASYYDLVDRIIVSYDQDARSWSGAQLSVEESLSRLRRADPFGKAVFMPGRYSDPNRPRMELETRQRQVALDAASEGAEWVLQLDTDEIVLSPQSLAAELDTAEAKGAKALDYPLRTIYARAGGDRFLEQSGRFWTPQASYPGAIAVAAGTRLRFARQVGDAPTHHVDIAASNTDPAHPPGTSVHSVIDPEEAILHLSWVRTEAQLAEKARVSGHAGDAHWEKTLSDWRRRSRHPLRTVALSPLRPGRLGHYRLTRLPEYAWATP